MLRSGSFDVEDQCCFSLWFNANGKDIGSLILLDDFTNIGNYLGDRGDVWRKTSHTLSKGKHKVSQSIHYQLNIILCKDFYTVKKFHSSRNATSTAYYQILLNLCPRFYFQLNMK